MEAAFLTTFDLFSTSILIGKFDMQSSTLNVEEKEKCSSVSGLKSMSFFIVT